MKRRRKTTLARLLAALASMLMLCAMVVLGMLPANSSGGETGASEERWCGRATALSGVAPTSCEPSSERQPSPDESPAPESATNEPRPIAPTADTVQMRRDGMLAAFVDDPRFGAWRSGFVAAAIANSLEEAVPILERIARSEAPGEVRHRALTELARVALRADRERDDRRAEAWIDEALSLELATALQHADAHLLKAEALLRRNERRRAIEETNRAIAIDASALDAHVLRLELVTWELTAQRGRPLPPDELEDVFDSLDRLMSISDNSILADIRKQLWFGGAQPMPLGGLVQAYFAASVGDVVEAESAARRALDVCEKRRCAATTERRLRDLLEGLDIQSQ